MGIFDRPTFPCDLPTSGDTVQIQRVGGIEWEEAEKFASQVEGGRSGHLYMSAMCYFGIAGEDKPATMEQAGRDMDREDLYHAYQRIEFRSGIRDDPDAPPEPELTDEQLKAQESEADPLVEEFPAAEVSSQPAVDGAPGAVPGVSLPAEPVGDGEPGAEAVHGGGREGAPGAYEAG